MTEQESITSTQQEREPEPSQEVLNVPTQLTALPCDSSTIDELSPYVNEVAIWQPDEKFNRCFNCSRKFTFLLRRHHCRCCGNIYCESCCSNFVDFDKSKVKLLRRFEEPPYRICDLCFKDLMKLAYITRGSGESDDSMSENSENNDSDSQQSHQMSTVNSHLVAVPSAGEETFCPVCNLILSQFQNEELAAAHVEDCIRNAELAHKASSSSSSPSRAKSRNRPKMLVYKVSATSGKNHILDTDHTIPDNNKVGNRNEAERTEGNLQECPICFEDIEIGEKVARLECLCVFHYHCIKSWIKKKEHQLKESPQPNGTAEINRNFCPFHDAIL
ncbi:phosphatidylinositol-3-phosphate-binding ubiquitin-protein ligase NDAI_0C04230 [Naumovozyma dairenensis CBS 421]|uniref:FYVE-type domain-containing protein n=1 Tax=Naumovozyma dairenensis (strain ATCC 10597 / BCRC 20456 / CBS 421 / NBRC 0211 / NRRL Y-12639) TaxID=1071378 RepID=G0W8H2_NAUDC|nr:hypothetical protein NDAI_0C04230 [Naumovozyma dairenensis CBS 421]CCD24083.1 hypothetical protein NDAI_0C04230 [Naumovozyma dairenensis CBS 421]